MNDLGEKFLAILDDLSTRGTSTAIPTNSPLLTKSTTKPYDSTGRANAVTEEEFFGRPKESDPTGRKPFEPGAKLDAGKICAFRGAVGYFPRAILAVAAVSTFGASKYAWKGWETVPEGFERYSDALVRHLLAEGKGEVADSDSGLLHAAHAAWNALARLELLIKEEEGKKQNEA